MDNTGIRFAVRVDHCLVIDPEPKNMSSRLIEWKLIGSGVDIYSNSFIILKIISVDEDWEGEVREM